ncbi:L-fuculokinase [Inquilinus sp. YAF38]|uniref:FGGY-family carbohydrate kinase n=1 Tax=Inquilinus sp. YAF38 TaxID=3233084 RepID=UPI003F936130
MATRFDPPFLIGIDVGTRSVRAIAFDARGRRAAQAARPTPARMQAGGRGEYDPDALFAAVTDCLAEVARSLAGKPVAGLAVGSVGESCVLVDDSGRSLAPSLVWFDRRTEAAARELAETIGPDRIFQITGLALDPTLTLCKLAWMRAHWPEAMGRARRVLAIADWIAFRLTGVAATEPTLASRTLYFDIHERRWSEELLGLAGLDPALLPPILAAGAAIGPVRPEVLAATGLAGRPVVATGGHDHLCGSYAAGITRPGMLLDSLGTAEAVLLATAFPLLDPAVMRRGFIQGAIGTQLSYLGGGINSSGGAVEWFRSLTGQAEHEALIAEARAVEPGSQGVVFLPHLVYSPPPDPDTSARGAFIGLTAHADRGALYRAVLEGLAMQARLMVDAMAALPGITPPTEIRAIGGSSRNALFLEIKANVYGRPITVVDEPEATALGAALLGGIAAGLWPDLDAALAAIDQRHHTVAPDPALAERYDALHRSVFERLHATLTPLNHALAGFDRKAELVPA